MEHLSSMTKDLQLSSYKNSFTDFPFQGKTRLKRIIKKKSAPLAECIDLDHDLKVPESYLGPRFETIDGVSLDKVQRFFAQNGRLARKYAYKILVEIDRVFRQSPMVTDIKVPKDGHINVCGDVHGQYYDLLKIFQLRGPPSPTNFYVFNGDIVDKGTHSVECILLLFLYKLVYPQFVHLNRGNHECEFVNRFNGFEAEIKAKYADNFLFKTFGDVFQYMPIATLIDQRVFIVHGGIKANVTLDEIRRIQRPCEPDVNTLVGDLLWSDPVMDYGIKPSTRGVGFFFGPDVTKKFLEKNGLLYVVRSHTEIPEGCGRSHEGCYTVFSAPSKIKAILGGILVIKRHLEKEGM
eukprot:maker-scaffold739_size104321-snap-gene-0.19 protein:Tk01009 transcript:maker-scaffold739_size104321-snap-gene-0.19-mRNA-1 annotation:"serine threonine-protein phosphatase 5"